MAVGLALVLLGWQPLALAQLVGVASASAAVRAGSWDPEALPALRGTAGTGPLFTPVAGDVVDVQRMGVAVSPRPVLRVELPANQQVRFEVRRVDGVVLESERVTSVNRVASWQVPAGVMRAGMTYQVAVFDTMNRPLVPPRALAVDVQRSAEQQLHGFANASVSTVTGELVAIIRTEEVPTVSGPAGFTLMYRPSGATQVGVPSSWSLHPSGFTARWESLTLMQNARIATLQQADGFAMTFARSGEAGAYVAQVSPHHGWRGGIQADLYANPDGTFSVIDANQGVTGFPAASGSGTQVLHPNVTWDEAAPSLQQRWREDGRLQALFDPVSERRIEFRYGGSDPCPAPVAGFIKAPDGMVCSVRDWAGGITRIGYVETPAGAQIGRVVVDAQAGQQAAVTDFRYDASGRITGFRQPLAAAAMAAGVIGGLTNDDERAMTTIEYDALGRVNQIASPANLVAGDTQPAGHEARTIETYQYQADAQGRMTFTARQSSTATPGEQQVVERRVANISTMDQTLITGADGCGSRTTFNEDDNATTMTNTCDGTHSQTRYNRQGQAISSVGPTRLAFTNPGAPVKHLARDTTDRGRTATTRGDAQHGLAFYAWANARFSGAPEERSVGPLIGGRIPEQLSVSWPQGPAGEGAWSARLSGEHVAPEPGTYRFRPSQGVQLTIGGQTCTPAAPCLLELSRGDHTHLQASFTSQGYASVRVEVSHNNAAWSLLSTRDLVPALNQITEQDIVDQLAPGARAETLKTTMSYDNQHGGQLIGQTSPEGTTVGFAWDKNTGEDSHWGQRVSSTNAAGIKTFETNYGGTQKASGCGQTAIQGGLLKKTTPPGPATLISRQVYDNAGRILQATGGTDTRMCVNYDASGSATSGKVTGPGPDYARAADAMVGGNPLESSITQTAQGVTTRGISRISILGQPYQTIDQYGTTTTYAYSAANQRPTSITEQTQNGEQRVRTFTYDALGRVTSMSIDGVTLERVSYLQDGSIDHIEYANGTTSHTGLDRNNNVTSRIYSGFANGASVGETSSFSRGGAVLTRTLKDAQGNKATFTYAYNGDHRLIDSDLSGTLVNAPRHTSLDFDSPSGHNGNRQHETVTTPRGTKTYASIYNTADKLLSTTKPGVGKIAYDEHGRTTKISDTSLAYDAGGNLTRLNNTNGTISFNGAGETTYTPSSGQPITLRTSGDLLLDENGTIQGQLLTLTGGATVGLDNNGTPIHWTYTDLQGSTTWRTTTNTAPTHTTVYDAWGENLTPTTPTITTPLDLALSMQGWAGTTRLPITPHITIIGAREYSPLTGRFLQRDTIAGSMNPYEYALGDPLNNRDPSGSLTTVGKWAGMFAAVAVGFILTVATKGAFAAIGIKGIKGVIASFFTGAATGATASATSSAVEQQIDNGAIDPQALTLATQVGAIAGGALSGLGAGYELYKHNVAAAELAAIRLANIRHVIKGYAGWQPVDLKRELLHGGVEGARDAFVTEIGFNIYEAAVDSREEEHEDVEHEEPTPRLFGNGGDGNGEGDANDGMTPDVGSSGAFALRDLVG